MMNKIILDSTSSSRFARLKNKIGRMLFGIVSSNFISLIVEIYFSELHKFDESRFNNRRLAGIHVYPDKAQQITDIQPPSKNWRE